MATIISGNNFSDKKKCKHTLKIDMTPMVDLGFLLITFFIFTTSIAEPMATNLFIPKEGSQTNLSEAVALTVLLGGENKIYYYDGKWENAFSSQQILPVGYSLSSGIGKIIRDKQKILGSRKGELMLLIKPSGESTYNNLINMLDETMINAVKKYAVVDLSAEEKSFLRQ